MKKVKEVNNIPLRFITKSCSNCYSFFHFTKYGMFQLFNYSNVFFR